MLALLLVAGLSLRVWYASATPNSGRFWDEGYSLDNVRPILIDGSFQVVSGYYPSPVVSLPPALLMRVSEAIYQHTGREAFKVHQEGSFLPAGYLISRWLQSLYGTVGLLLVFLIGRRMFSPAVGLLATLAMTFCPWHIHASAVFKPDALLTTAVLLAFYGSLAVVQEQRLRAAVGTGLAIALALSAKLTGGLIALPLTLATLLPAWRFERRRFGLLALAGVVSGGVFVLTNPNWAGYVTVLKGLRRDYAMRAGWSEQTRLEIPGKVGALIVDDYGLGLVFGSLGLLGFVLLGVTVWRRGRPPLVRIERGMLLVLPPIYVVTYALQTAYFKPNNFLHVLPLVALCGAWFGVAVWRRLAARWSPLGSPLGKLLAVALALVVLAPAGLNYVYRSIVPTTYDAARLALAKMLRPPQGRIAYEEIWQQPRTRWESAKPFASSRAGLRRVEQLSELDDTRLDLSDGLLFPAANLAGASAAFYQRQVDRVPAAQRRTFRAKLLELRGPSVIALAHQRVERAPALRLVASRCGSGQYCLQAELSDELAAGELVSLRVWLPDATTRQVQEVPDLQVGDQRFDLLWTRRRGKGHSFVTDRFTIPASRPALRLLLDSAVDEGSSADLVVHRW